MNNTQIIDDIRNKMAKSQSSFYNTNLYEDNFLSQNNILKFFELNNNSENHYMDIPVKSILAISRNSAFKEGIHLRTWKDLLNNYINGFNWTSNVYKYWDNDLKDNNFPAPESMHCLKIKLYSGIGVCLNGNHRLIAGASYLIAKNGNDAVFKKAYVEYELLNEQLLNNLLLKCKENSKISILYEEKKLHNLLETNIYSDRFICIRNDKIKEFYFIEDNVNLKKIEIKQSFIDKSFSYIFGSKLENLFKKYPFIILPQEFIKIYKAKNSWIDRSLKTSEIIK